MRRKTNRLSRDAAFIPQEASIKAYTSSLIASGLGGRCPAMLNSVTFHGHLNSLLGNADPHTRHSYIEMANE